MSAQRRKPMLVRVPRENGPDLLFLEFGYNTQPLEEKLLPCLESLLKQRDTAAKRKFYQLIAALPKLLRDEGTHLSSNVISAQCGTSATSVLKWIRQLEDAGLLTPTCLHFIPGQKARTYAAVGALAKQMKAEEQEVVSTLDQNEVTLDEFAQAFGNKLNKTALPPAPRVIEEKQNNTLQVLISGFCNIIGLK